MSEHKKFSKNPLREPELKNKLSLPPPPPLAKTASSKIGVNPELLEILTQQDFLTISAEALQAVEHRKTRDGISLTSSSLPLGEDACYVRWFHVGKTAGTIDSHIITVGRNFLLRSLQNKAEWETVLDDFQKAALMGLTKAIEMGYTAPRGGANSTELHYFRFYYACNLRIPRADDQDAAQVPSQSAGESIRKILDNAVLQVPNIRLASEKNRTSMSLVTQELLASQLSEETAKDILSRNRRLVFEIGAGTKLKLSPTILGGVHAFVLETEGPRPSPSKITFTEPNPEKITAESIDELSELVNSKVTCEPDFQRYFEKYPSLLCEDASYRIYSQIVLERDDGTTLRPDFFLEPVSSGLERLPAVVDLKLPTEELILNQTNRSRFYSKIYQYAAQLREYGDYLDNPSNRKRVLECYGIKALRPRLVMVVGKDYGTADYSLIERVNRSIFPVEVRTYNDILRFGRSLLAKRFVITDSGNSK